MVEYTYSQTKIKIICKSHGVYEQPPSSHLRGNGCPICAYESKGRVRTAIAKSEFTTKATIIHNNKYDYELVEYKNNKSKVKILCKSHGIFEQAPNDHLNGKGCPSCALAEKGWSRTAFAEKCEKNNNGLGILYILECFNDNERFYKIGITSNSVKKRYCSKASMPYAYRVIDEIIGEPTYIYNLEIKLHQINKENQYMPSIPFGGHATECFSKYEEK